MRTVGNELWPPGGAAVNNLASPRVNAHTAWSQPRDVVPGRALDPVREITRHPVGIRCGAGTRCAGQEGPVSRCGPLLLRPL